MTLIFLHFSCMVDKFVHSVLLNSALSVDYKSAIVALVPKIMQQNESTIEL